MVKTRTSRDQADLPDNEEPSRSRATSKNDQQAEHPTNGFQSDSSHEEQFMSRKRRRSYHEDSEDSSRSIRHRLRRVRRNRSPPMRSSSHRYYERESLKLRTRSRDSLGIRRSTRQKKLRYETYDQNLIEKQFSMMDRDSEDEMSPREISTRRRQAQKYISQDEESDDEEEDDDEEERSVKMKTRRGSDDALEKHNDEEADENKDTANREEGGRMLLRKGRKRAEVAEEEMEDGEQPKRSHKRMEVEPMPEAEALDMYTRVKRERPRVKRDMYGIPINDDDEKDDKSTSDSETEVDRIDEDTDDNDERNNEKTAKKKCYNLRLQCRKTNLYSAPPIKPQRSHRRSLQSLGRPFQSLGSSTEDFRSPIRRRRKRAAFHSSTSSSSATDDEAQFERRKSKSMAKARQRCLPMNLTAEDVASGVIRDRGHSGASLADVEPMAIDKSVLFDSIGGLAKHLQALKEMIVFPLIYPEVFTRFKITPPRGVLFHGPPGTGKTLVARALANECSQGDTKVAFFMRKGADCLSKWVGESERQLRLLFDQAYQMRPAIIFFDEIDGLAPVRSSRQDQIHSSIVSTLLALMDGLDDRGEVVVIGATNRIDSIDPALRRPGRFDREFLFPLPTLEARKQILQIHTKEWNPALSTDFVADLARRTVGYCGADVKALCTEAALHALRRRYPQIYNSRDKLLIDVSSINIRSLDFYHAMDRITPTAQRSASSPAKALGEIVRPLLKAALGLANSALQRVFPSAFTASASHGIGDDEYSDDDLGADVINQEGSTELRATMHQISSSRFLPPTYRPRLLLAGDQGQGQSSHLGPALLHQMENLAVNVVDLPALLAVGTRTPEESCAQIIREARRNIPSILYLPHVNELWDVIGDVVRAMLLNLLGDLDPSVPLLLLATCETQFERLPSQVRELFRDEVIVVPEPDEAKRREFFENLLLHQVSQLPVSRRKTERKVEVLPKAPKPEPRKLTEEEQGRLYAQEETTLRELRLFLRDVINKLGRDRKFSLFAKPVDREEVPDYYDIIKNPMDLSTMMTRIDLHKYETVAQFLLDIDLICSNALEYNPDKDPQDRAIRHRACALKDTTNAIIAAELDLDFGLLCEDIARARKNRNFSVKEVPVPSYYFTKPLNPSTSAANDPADGCPATVGRRTRSHSTNESSSSATVVAEPLANADTQKKPDKDNSFPRRVVKRIRFCRPRKTTGFKSPWCRTSKPIYKKVVVYVDRNGKEIPESEYKKALADRTCNVSVTCENLKETCSSESIGQCKSDGLKSASAEGSCGPATRCQGKRRSSVEAPEDGGRPAANEISKVSPVSNNKSLSINHASPVPENSQTRSTTDESSLSPDKASPGPPMAHDHQTRKAVQTLAKMLKTVVTDPSRQRNLLDETVQRTRGFSVERLEKLHSQLSLCVYRHRNEYNKMQLLKDLESVIGSISTVRPPNHHRP